MAKPAFGGAGAWLDDVTGFADLFVALPLAAVEPPDPAALLAIAHLRDAEPNRRDPNYRPAWNGALRLFKPAAIPAARLVDHSRRCEVQPLPGLRAGRRSACPCGSINRLHGLEAGAGPPLAAAVQGVRAGRGVSRAAGFRTRPAFSTVFPPPL